VSKNTQIGIRLPNDLYTLLVNERSQALERGEKVTLTDLVVKYLYRGLGDSPALVRAEELTPTLERLTHVLERLESKI
jgi:hypothetical protein